MNAANAATPAPGPAKSPEPAAASAAPEAGSSAAPGAARDAGAVLALGKTVEVFYDGDCPLCMREIRMLRRKDRHARIQFTDIAAPEFTAEAYGRSYASFMERIAGRLADGTWLEGVEVFRQLYAAIGWRRAVAVSRLWGIAHLLALGYRVFAKNRLRLTGRCAPDGTCRVPAAR